jgi:hypothetical protein
MNSAPLLAVSTPATGHCLISALASIRAGRTAASRGMSSQEMWLATRSSPPPGGAAPVIRSRTPVARTIVRHHVRVSRSRHTAASRPTTGISTIPKRSTARSAASRSRARGTAAGDPTDSTQTREHGALGSHALTGAGAEGAATGRSPALPGRSPAPACTPPRRGRGTFPRPGPGPGNTGVLTPGLTSVVVPPRRGRSFTATRATPVAPIALIAPMRDMVITPARATGSAAGSAG